MSKEAKTKFEIHPLLKQRWSPRAFSDKTVRKAQLQRLFEAARWAPSGMNEQPWRFIVGFKGDDTYHNIYESLVEFNRLWARFAPVLVVSLGKKVYTGKEEINPSYNYDVGQAVAHLSFQAMNEGLYVHQMGGYDPAQIVSRFSVPAKYKPETVFAIGHIGESYMLHPNLKPMEEAGRERKGFDELVFTGKFGEPLNIF